MATVMSTMATVMSTIAKPLFYVQSTSERLGDDFLVFFCLRE
jgi:hypothetical protein